MTDVLYLAETLKKDWGKALERGITWGADGRGFVPIGEWTDWNAWLILWPYGVAKGVHDHCDSEAAYLVIAGEIEEARFSPKRRRSLRDGNYVTVPPNTPHDVWATSDWALGLHVYSPRLTRMNLYDENGAQIVGVEDVDRG